MKVGLTLKGALRISITCKEQRELRAIMRESENPDSDYLMHEYMEQLTCNSDYDWIDPAWTGDLTDAPMLGHFGEEKELPEGADQVYYHVTGAWDGKIWHEPVTHRWAWMGYETESFLGRLVKYREIFLEGGPMQAVDPREVGEEER
jgi:hypothetical protein